MNSSCKIIISSRYDRENIIWESITSIELPDSIQKELNKLAKEYRCIGWNEEGLRMFFFERAIKKANNVYFRIMSNEEVNDMIYKFITQLNTNIKLEEFIQNYLNPEIEAEKGRIQRRIEKEFIDRLPEDVREYIEEIKNGFHKYPDENQYISINFDDIAELQQMLLRSDILFSEYVYKEFLPSLNESVEKAGYTVPETFKLKVRQEKQASSSDVVKVKNKMRGRKPKINWQEVNRMLRFELTNCRSEYENNHKINKTKLAKKVCNSYNLSETEKKTIYKTIYKYLNSDKCPDDIKKLLG